MVAGSILFLWYTCLAKYFSVSKVVGLYGSKYLVTENT